MDSIKYQQIKINKWLTVRNLIMGHVCIFQPYNNPNTNLKNSTKMGRWAQNQTSSMTIPVLWHVLYRTWVRWTEEEKHRHGAGNLKDLEWFWMKEWSLISCQVFSNLNIGENIRSVAYIYAMDRIFLVNYKNAMIYIYIYIYIFIYIYTHTHIYIIIYIYLYSSWLAIIAIHNRIHYHSINYFLF